MLLYIVGLVTADVPLDAFDIDDLGDVNLADPIYELNYLFRAGPPPPAPFPATGLDPTPTDPYTEGDVDRPTANAPDLAIKGYTFDGDQILGITFANDGTAEVPADAGDLTVFIDGHAVRVYRLADLDEQSFRAPGASQTLQTDLRLAGSLRRLGISIDSEEEIDELNEFQNTVTRTITLPVPVGPDLVVRDLSIDADNELRVVVENTGSMASLGGVDAELSIWVGGALARQEAISLAALSPGEATTITPSNSVQITDTERVRVSLRTAVSDEIDNSNNTREETLPDWSSLAAYDAILGSPRIQAAIVWPRSAGVRSYEAWTPEEKGDLIATIRALEQGEPFILSEPPALNANALSAADAWHIYLLHLAQSLWVEVHGIVNWSLLDVPDDQLPYLFDGRQLVFYYSAADRYGFLTSLMGSVTAWNPRIAYEFLSNLKRIRPTPLETINALTDWMRAHLIHTLGSNDFSELFGYSGQPPVDRVLYALEGKKHKTAGCWGTSGLYAAVLRSVNIPVRRANVPLSNGTHSRPEFVSVDRSMPHGDDLYTTTLIPSGAVIPSENLLYTLAEMEMKFLVPKIDCLDTDCNTIGEQASYNSGRDKLLLAYTYLADSLLYQYAVFGPDYLDDSLRGPRIGGGVVEYAMPYFSEPERTVMIAAVEARLLEIGDGDLAEGRRIVQTRYSRFGSNK